MNYNSFMADAILAGRFWAAVRDCLIEFLNMQSEKAAAAVVESWNRMSNLNGSMVGIAPKSQDSEQATGLSDMIYHAQPWSIACNLTGEDLSLDDCRWQKYQQILSRHQLA
jgi:predicted small secreted protein